MHIHYVLRIYIQYLHITSILVSGIYRITFYAMFCLQEPPRVDVSVQGAPDHSSVQGEQREVCRRPIKGKKRQEMGNYFLQAGVSVKESVLGAARNINPVAEEDGNLSTCPSYVAARKVKSEMKLKDRLSSNPVEEVGRLAKQLNAEAEPYRSTLERKTNIPGGFIKNLQYSNPFTALLFHSKQAENYIQQAKTGRLTLHFDATGEVCKQLDGEYTTWALGIEVYDYNCEKFPNKTFVVREPKQCEHPLRNCMQGRGEKGLGSYEKGNR